MLTLNNHELLANLSVQLDWTLLAPLLVLQLALLVYCLADLIRRDTVVGGNKLVWAGVIIVLGILGQIAYLVVGRGEG